MGSQFLAAEWPELAIAIFHHRNTVGQPMTFADREWLIPIYKDKSPKMVIQKSVQCGISEYLIIRSMASMLKNKSILYVLPSLEVRNDFVNNRIDRQTKEIEFYRRGSYGTDNVGMKHFWGGTIKFVGSNVAMAFREYPAQALIVDELDQCDLQNIVYSIDRMSAAKQLTGQEPTTIFVSNPTISGYGINREYEASNKMHWMITCPYCNKWQTLDWFKNYVNQTDDKAYSLLSPVSSSNTGSMDVEALCSRCNKPFDRLTKGQWVAEHPDNPIHGYHVSQLMTNQTSIRDIWTDFSISLFDQTKLQHFYNSILGLPYTGEGDRLSFEDFRKCVLPEYRLPLRGEACIAGVDPGAILHVRIDSIQNGKRRMAFAGSVPNWQELLTLFKRYGVRLYVIDYLPETHMAREFLSKCPGGFLCQFHSSEGTRGEAIDRKERIIKANRTESLDDATAAYLNGLIELPMDWAGLDDGDWVKQMIAPTRVLDIKRRPPAYVWDEGGQPDHHRFADNYCNMAAKMAGLRSSAPVLSLG